MQNPEIVSAVHLNVINSESEGFSKNELQDTETVSCSSSAVEMSPLLPTETQSTPPNNPHNLTKWKLLCEYFINFNLAVNNFQN